MTEEEKLVRQAQGYSIFEHKGKTICLNTENFNKDRFCKDWEFNEVKVFTEESGNKILYDPTQYKEITRTHHSFLHYRGHSEKPIQPVGCINYQRMFANRFELTSLDLTNWDFNEALNFSEMFKGCDGLRAIIFPKNSISRVTDFSFMFYCCKNLKSLDIGDWDVSQAISMRQMFAGCSNLEKVDLKKWDTQRVVDMDRMFARCKKMKYPGLDNWDNIAVKGFY